MYTLLRSELAAKYKQKTQKHEEQLHPEMGKLFESVHEISNNVVCATSKASDQPAHTRSLIRAFASRLTILWVLSYWLDIIWSF